MSLTLDTMAGYAFARLRFKGSQGLFLLVLVTLMIPFQVVMVPLYYRVFRLGLMNTSWG